MDFSFDSIFAFFSDLFKGIVNFIMGLFKKGNDLPTTEPFDEYDETTG